MSDPRVMYENLITSAMLSAETTKGGIVGLAVKAGTGAASAVAGGLYTGTGDLLYTVEIDSVAAGAEIGQATFRWKDGGTAWDASGVTTASTPLTLNNGVTIKWTAGSGDDFVVGDEWKIFAVNHFGLPKLLDWDRAARWRSSGLSSPDWLKVDFGSAKQIKVCVISDHNFSSGATLKLQAHATDAWGAPSYDQSLTWASGVIVIFLDQTYRYWRLSVTDAANADGYVAVGDFYLGDYVELPFLRYQDPEGLWAHQTETMTEAGREERRVGAQGREFEMSFLATAAEKTALSTLFETVQDTATGRAQPFFYCPDPASPSSAWLVRVSDRLPIRPVPVDRYAVDFRLREVADV